METLSITYHLQYSAPFAAVLELELADLQRRGTWTVLDVCTVSKASNIFRGRFVHTLKNSDTSDPSYKALFVAEGHRYS